MSKVELRGEGGEWDRLLKDVIFSASSSLLGLKSTGGVQSNIITVVGEEYRRKEGK